MRPSPGIVRQVRTPPEPRCRSNRHAITILVYDRGMPVSVNVQTVHSRKLAAVRREGAVGSAWGPALGNAGKGLVPKGQIGNKNFNIKDPDGHIVEIVEYQPDSWTAQH